MLSKTLEISGLGLVAWGIASLLGTAAGLIFAGIALVFVGSLTDDASVSLAFIRGSGWTRYAWHRQLARENGIHFPSFKQARLPEGWIPCECGKDEGCPVCGGLGHIPDPKYQENPRSPHPLIKVNPQAEAFWGRLANARKERSKLRDRTPALSRYGPDTDDDLERLA